METCLIESCVQPGVSRGLCNSDYNKQYRLNTLDLFPLQGGQGPTRRPTSIRKMNRLEIGWVAAIIEGEGNIRLNSGNQMQIRVGMTDQDVIERLRTITGVGNITIKNVKPELQSSYTATGAPIKPLHTWSVTAHNDVIHLLVSIVPLLGNRRRVEVGAMLNSYKGVI